MYLKQCQVLSSSRIDGTGKEMVYSENCKFTHSIGNKKELPSLLKESVTLLTDKTDNKSYSINYRLDISLTNYI